MSAKDDERRLLEQEIARLQGKLAELDAPEAPASDPRLDRIRSLRAQKMPVRDWVLDTLSEARVPLYSQYLTSLHLARFSSTLAAGRLGTLSADERKKIEAGRDLDVALVHGLAADRGTAIKRIWARSDWPLSQRIVAETSGRVLFLKTAAWIFDEAARADPKWANLEALALLAEQLARDVPIDKPTDRDFAGWRDRARAELERFEGPDRERREAAADALTGALNARQLLLGAADPFMVLPGTDEQSWKESKP